MKNLSIPLAIVLSLFLFSCKDNVKEPELEVVTVDNSEGAQEKYKVAKSDAVFKDEKIQTVFNQYLEVETALVNTDAEATSNAASKLESLLKETQPEGIAQVAASAIASTQDIKLQREAFEDLSNGMEKLLEGSLESGVLYKQYCPMAFNNKGASWISSGKEILNPYFGDKMLKCGRVEAEIK